MKRPSRKDGCFVLFAAYLATSREASSCGNVMTGACVACFELSASVGAG